MVDRIDNLLELNWDDAVFMDTYSIESKLLAESIGDADAELKDEMMGIVEYYQSHLEEMKNRTV